MTFNVVGIHPEPITNHILHKYDGLASDEEKARYLKNNNRPFGSLNSSETVEGFKDGKTVDINSGELLGLCMVAMYYNWLGEDKGNTYQVVAGIEDRVKTYKEKLLSDGAIWHDQTQEKMLYQTTMAQGYVPKKVVSTDDIVKVIDKKAKRREDYADNCGLIVNVFAEEQRIDFQRVYQTARASKFNEVYMILYDIPGLNSAQVFRMSHTGSPMLTLNLLRHPADGI